MFFALINVIIIIIIILYAYIIHGVNTVAINFSAGRRLNTCLQLSRRIGTKTTRGPHDTDVLEPVTNNIIS